MPRLANKSFTGRAPQTSGAWPEIPDLSPQISVLDGGRSNAALQRWNDLVRQRLAGNELLNNDRFRNVQVTNDNQDGYLESVWTMEAIAGPVVTGMTLFSASDRENNTTISRVTFQADVFQIQTASGNHKQLFSASADEIKLGDVLTVDLANAKVYMGGGTFGNSSTAFYVDSLGRLSLTDKFTWDGTTFTVAGWELNATTLSKNNATLDSAGQLILGTLNDVVYISAIDATYRLWIGDVTAGSAAFRVTKSGAMFATAATISGSSVFSGTVDIGSGTTRTVIDTSALTLGYASSQRASLFNSGAGPSFFLYYANDIGVGISAQAAGGSIAVNTTFGVTTILLTGSTGAILASSFAGDGAALTSLNASNISTGTLSNLRLAFSPGNLASRNIGAFNATADAPVIGYAEIPDSGGTNRKFAVIA